MVLTPKADQQMLKRHSGKKSAHPHNVQAKASLACHLVWVAKTPRRPFTPMCSGHVGTPVKSVGLCPHLSQSVCSQGDWIGFRSASAEDRFLQLRRRGRQKLAFHSANFGVWEQWELVAGEPKQAWNTQRMGLRNRQLQQVSQIWLRLWNMQL